MGNPVVHFEVTGEDGDALVAFYSELFGWRTTAVEGMGYHLVEQEEGGIGGGVGAAADGNGLATFYVQVDDPQAALDKAVELGGSVVAPVVSIPNMATFALLADPEGNVIGIAGSETPTG